MKQQNSFHLFNLRRLLQCARIACLAIVLVLSPSTLLAQNTEREVSGVVADELDLPMPGVSITVRDSPRGVIAGVDGSFTIKVKDSDVLLFSFLGYEKREIPVKGQRMLMVKLAPKADELEGVTVVGFGRQKKESVIAAVSTINPKDLRVPASNLTQGLAGRMAGLITHQSSGEPGKDNTNFFVRGVTTFGYSQSPLILIDNIESTQDDLADLAVDDVASFSIMKDATATAIYGARGANGVILVTTKQGREGRAKVSVRIENSISTPSRSMQLADPITYMKMYNEAVSTRDPFGFASKPFSPEKIAKTELGYNPYVYPAVDWYDELFKKVVMNQRANINLSGGSPAARYYVSGSMSNENGALNVDKNNNYNSNINLKKIQLRANVNLDLTKTTRLDVRVNTHFEDYNGPIDGGNEMYRKVRSSSPVHFPAKFAPDVDNQLTQHTLFGNYGADAKYLNPYADMVRGYKESGSTSVVAQLELSQKFDFITEGLSARILANTSRNSSYSLQREIIPFYYSVGFYDEPTNTYNLNRLNDNGREDLSYTPQAPQVNQSYYFEGMVNYARTFSDKHSVGGLLVATMRESRTGNASSIQQSLPFRNIGLSGRLTYAYDSRYLFEATFGYNGSERFAQKERFGFFPSAGVGYIISNESFWPKNKVVNMLKLKTTYGLVGNDQIGDPNTRFYYLSEVNLNNGNSGISFGDNFTQGSNTIAISRYGNDKITWEIARKLDVGLELELLNCIQIHADYFQEKRSNIFQERPTIPTELGFASKLDANVGRASSYGFEVQADASRTIGKHAWISFRGNFTFARSNYDFKEEEYKPNPWNSEIGFPIGQIKGLIADRLFVDDEDIANSPRQTYGPYMAGDIKYRDINGDDIIDSSDVVPLGYPNIPEIIYGFGVSFQYKSFDVSCFFQGAARSSFYINAKDNTPFLNSNIGDKISPNVLLQSWADSYWSESNRDSYAAQPRLTTEHIENNVQGSTWYLRDGSYLRLKSVEIGYTLPTQFTKKIAIESLRIYMSGLNLLAFSKFKDWDVEQGNSGFNYPIQSVYNIGINVNF